MSDHDEANVEGGSLMVDGSSRLSIQPSAIHHQRSTLALPLPRIAIDVRPGTLDDLPFMDALQKVHQKQVGFMPTKALEGKIRLGHVLVAWAARPCSEDTGGPPVPQEERVGYCIGNDQYFKHE